MSDGNTFTIQTYIQSNFPKFDTRSLKPIDSTGRNNVFSINHADYGKCVFKFLTTDRNLPRYIKKVHPAIERLYQRCPHHPHIATVEKPVEYRPNTFFVVIRELGEPYSDYLKNLKKQLNTDNLIDHAHQISHGLAQLQWAGINHRDVKPSNIIRMPDGVLKIIDFDISKTLRSDDSKVTLTENAMTIRFASPARLRLKQHPELLEQYPSMFKEDAFSLGIVFLEMMLSGRDEPFHLFDKQEFMKPEIRIRESLYEKSVQEFLQYVKDKLIVGPKLTFFFLLIQNLLNWNSKERIDLMAVCKYIRLVKQGKFESKADSLKYLNEESVRGQKRQTGDVCMIHESKWGYLEEKLDFQEVKQVEYGALSQDSEFLLIFHGSNNSITSYKIPQRAPGAGVLTTPNNVYIFGGEDPTSGDVLNLCFQFTTSSRTWRQCPDVPDSGRSDFTPASIGNLIALVGGFRDNCNMASRILCFNMVSLKWESDKFQLNVRRLNPATCFTQQYLYIFGGLTSQGQEAIQYSGQIERIEITDLQSAHFDQKAEVVQLRESQRIHEAYLKFIYGMALLINPDQIMIFGGLRDPGYDEECAGLLYNWKKRTFTQLNENWGVTRTCFSQPGYVCGNTIFISQQLHKTNPLFLKGTFKANTLEFTEHEA